MVALHEAEHCRGADSEDVALISLRAPYTIAAISAITHARHRAIDRGHSIVLPAHLLEVLLEHEPVREVLAVAGRNPDAIASSVRRWLDEDAESRRAGIDGPAYRATRDVSSRSVTYDQRFEYVIDDAIRHVRPDGPVDSLALLLAELARERDTRGFFDSLFNRKLEPGPDTFLIIDGVRWMATAMAVFTRRDALGAAVDRPSKAAAPPGDSEVVLLNDDKTSFEFVVEVLREILLFPTAHAWFVATTVHRHGEAVIASVDEATARSIIQRVESRARAAGFPLTATIRKA